MLEKEKISSSTIKRLPLYLSYLKLLPESEVYVSATKIADSLMLNHVKVRKDLACISTSGKPRVGYETKTLISELEKYLGYTSVNNGIIIGAGRLGKALLNYKRFKLYGLDVLAAFDIDEDKVSSSTERKPLLPIRELDKYCKENNVKIAIITVPDMAAQQVADLLVECGIKSIWNFSSARIIAPSDVMVLTENMAASMAVLVRHLEN